MIIRLDQERVIFQNIHQQILCRIHRNPDLFSLKSFHDPFIHIPRKCIRDTSGKYKYISCRQLIQFLIECLNRCICNNRSLSVDLTFLI